MRSQFFGTQLCINFADIEALSIETYRSARAQGAEQFSLDIQTTRHKYLINGPEANEFVKGYKSYHNYQRRIGVMKSIYIMLVFLLILGSAAFCAYEFGKMANQLRDFNSRLKK